MVKNGDVNNRIAEYHFRERNIESTGTLRHVLPILQTVLSTTHLKKAGLLTLNQRFRIVFNSYQYGTNDLLAESSKTNYERKTGQLTSLTDNIE